MKQKEFETELVIRLRDIEALYKRYNPEAFEKNSVHLSMAIVNGNLLANNKHYLNETNNPDLTHPVDVFRQGGFSD